MKKAALCQAQFLYGAWRRSQEIADERDPKRQHQDDIANLCDMIADQCTRAFVRLTGRHPINLEGVWELNTEHPAQWTKEDNP